MNEEEAKREIISVFSEAGKGVSLWLEYAQPNDIPTLMQAVGIVKSFKEAALRREQQRIK
jgi:hypothetical protein